MLQVKSKTSYSFQTVGWALFAAQTESKRVTADEDLVILHSIFFDLIE